MKYDIKIGEKRFEVEVGNVAEGLAQVSVNGAPYEVVIENFSELTPSAAPRRQPARASTVLESPAPRVSTPQPQPAACGGAVISPIPGLVLDLKVKTGDTVAVGQVLAIIEAMKMENPLTSQLTGRVTEIRVQKGGEVSTGDVIMLIG
jgi:biotin carboxyl carrier protein